jgi:peptide/nickel transport system permease protein
VPALTAGAMERAAFFAGGLVVVERVLLVEGVGTLLWRAAELRDYDLAMGIAIVFAVVVAFAHALGDLLRMAIDPRGGRGWG